MEFKVIEDYEDYSINTDGVIMNNWNGNTINTSVGSMGYQVVSLTSPFNVRKLLYVHRLLAKAFIPNPENKPCVDHINNDRTNNNINNLRWCSVKENIRNSRLSRRNTSGHKGISFSNDTMKWRADIRINRKLYNLGFFTFIDDAIKMRNTVAREFFGEFINNCEL
jgi:hypothetical protein